MARTMQRVRLSWVRAVALPALVGTSEGIPGPGLGTAAGHLAAFRTARESGGEWLEPWRAERTYSRFWRRYLGRKDRYWEVAPGAMWPRLVPLWESPGPSDDRPLVSPDRTWPYSAQVTATVDRYLFPCAAAAVLTVQVGGPVDLAGLVAVAEEVASADAYVDRDGAFHALKPTLGRLLDEVQRKVLGRLDADATGDDDPLVVATVVEASGRQADARLTDGKTVHRALHALGAFDSGLLREEPPALATQSMAVSERGHGSALLVQRRARVVWSPQKMFDANFARALDCYHRNLVLASTVAESLLAYVGFLEGTGRRDETAKHAVNVLGMLYGPAPDIWSSSAIRRQIDDSHRVPLINRLRLELAGWGELKGRT